jgi:hypothetical protein
MRMREERGAAMRMREESRASRGGEERSGEWR